MIVGSKDRYIGNFRDPMKEAHIGPLRFRHWNLGRLRLAEVGCWTPLGELTISGHERPDGNIPMVKPTAHLNLRIGQRFTYRIA